MGTLSVGHWLVVLVVVAIVFGPKRLASVGKGLGEGLKGLRDGLAGRIEDEQSTQRVNAPTPEQRR